MIKIEMVYMDLIYLKIIILTRSYFFVDTNEST